VSSSSTATPTRTRQDAPDPRVVTAGPLSLDLDCHVARWEGREFELHGLEFDLLATLASQTGRMWTFADLTSRVWSHRYLGDPSAVASAIKRLRRRLRQQHVDVEIESVRGLGFRLAVLPRPVHHNGHDRAALPALDSSST
jgi:DNA-binding response OmpR family regulator